MSETETAEHRTHNPELSLIAALRAIVIEAMPDTPGERVSTESYLPGEFIAYAQAALAVYGAEVKPARTVAVRT